MNPTPTEPGRAPDAAAHAARARPVPAPRRRRVVLAWEHGRHWGHLQRLQALAALLAGHGLQPLWALAPARWHLPATRTLVGPRLLAPTLTVVAPDFAPHVNAWADILLTLGWGHAAHVGAAVRAWMDLLTRAQADAVVVDLAPAAQLAALLLGLPCHQVTNGFDRPPPECPLFGITGSGPREQALGRQRRDQLQHTLHAVGRQCAGRGDIDLPLFLESPHAVWVCVPEADPYAPRTGGFALGPLGGETPTPAPPLAWPAGPQGHPRVLAYLRSHPGAFALIDALRRAPARTVCVWPDAPAPLVQALADGPVHLYTQPLDLAPALAQADAVVNYGSGAMVSHTLLAGKPQLMAPIDAEKFVIAGAVARHGAGLCWRPALGASAALAQLLQDPALARNAAAIAQRHPPQRWTQERQRWAATLAAQAGAAS